MQVAVLNFSAVVTDDECKTMCAAVESQVEQHVAPAWGMAPVPVRFYTQDQDFPTDAIVIGIYENLPEAPGAGGYHTVNGKLIYGKVGARVIYDNGGSVLGVPEHLEHLSVSACLSHEVIEALVDLYVNDWCDGPVLQEGSSYAKEAADPCERDLYMMNGGGILVAVSDFVFPAYFNPNDTTGPFDWLGRLTAPFSKSEGGYMIVRDGNGHVSRLFGATYPKWLVDVKDHPLARTARRMSSQAARDNSSSGLGDGDD